MCRGPAGPARVADVTPCQTRGVGSERLEIAVVHHRVPAVLARCLEALAEAVPDVRVRVVDTAFDPSLAHQLDGVHPRLCWTAVPNHSLAAAVNAALRSSAAEVVAHMNADVFVRRDTFPELLEALDRPGVGMVGPVARTADGRLQDMGVPYRWHYARLAWARRRRNGASAAVDVPWLPGFLQVVPREVVRRLGGMDTSLRFYNEDLEWCLRLRRAGYRCRLVGTEVVHLGGASTPRVPRFLAEGVRGGYVVARRYAPPLVRAGHRLSVLAAAEVASRTVRDPERRHAWREIARRFRTADVSPSSFGATLSDDR
jgi:N-acetylglucosaminyl-diphospho-decaprenol L-rhamnosyltransferase